MPLQAAPGLARTEGRHIRGVIPGPIEAQGWFFFDYHIPSHIRGVIPGPIEASGATVSTSTACVTSGE